ncbi:LADA_0A03136g1_1 [Lachancea dasiensis]|uniref:LADA_0A03136g1_1 n=1 Tax=Lachancea dasiensis TaxID=1072105 RepID=A0A1G4IMS3_9SACH|nr:LADA_0A03136g1_1 [Lachancea dasiensis]
METDEVNEEHKPHGPAPSHAANETVKSLQLTGAYIDAIDTLVDHTHPPAIVNQSELASDVLNILCGGRGSCRYVFQNGEGSDLKAHFVLEHYVDGYWLLWKLKDVPLDFSNSLDRRAITTSSSSSRISSTLSNWFDLQIPDLLDLWKEDRQLHSARDPDVLGELDMGPRNKRLLRGNRKGAIDNSNQDPRIYLQRKYYETVFSFHIPLAYFVKSNLPRTKVMTQDQEQLGSSSMYQRLLADFLLTVDEFDARHKDNIMETDLNSEICSEVRQNCLNKVGDLIVSGGPTVLSNLLLVYKVRELRLQIIILIELIVSSSMDANLANFEERYGDRLQKRAKKVANKGLSSKLRRKKAHKTSRTLSLDYCEQLDIYLDKLSIIDMMLVNDISIKKIEPNNNDAAKSAIERSQGLIRSMANPGQESSSYGFTTYVLLPYYRKRAPHAVSFVSKRLKSPRFHHSSKIEKKQALGASSENLREAYTGHVPPNSPPPESHANITPLPASPQASDQCRTSGKIHKRTVLSQRPPTLISRSNSQLSDILEFESGHIKKHTTVGRGNSDLILNKLQRRQLPANELVIPDGKVTVNRSKSELSGLRESSIQEPVLDRSMTSGTFQRMRRRRIEPRKVKSTLEINGPVQVEATPHAKKVMDNAFIIPNRQIVESPSGSASKGQDRSLQGALPTFPFINTPSKSSVDFLQVPASSSKATQSQTGVVNSEKVEKRRVRRRLFASK